MKLSVVIPVYNEEKSIKDTISRIKGVLSSEHELDIIAVNDGSIDNTANILSNIAGIRVITNEHNTGYGASLKTGILNANNETIVMLDADGTYDPKDIPSLLRYVGEYELVTGVRTKKGAKIPLIRKPAKLVLSLLANFLTGIKIPDLNCGLRVIKKSNVLQYFRILPQRFSFTITHLLSCLTNGERVKFVPISYSKREGKSSIHPIKDFVKFITIIFRVIAYFKPLNFFLPLSVLLFFSSLVVLILSFTVFDRILDATIAILLIASIQTLFFGLIADIIIKYR